MSSSTGRDGGGGNINQDYSDPISIGGTKEKNIKATDFETIHVVGLNNALLTDFHLIKPGDAGFDGSDSSGHGLGTKVWD